MNSVCATIHASHSQIFGGGPGPGFVALKHRLDNCRLGTNWGLGLGLELTFFAIAAP